MPGKRKWTVKWRDCVQAANDGYLLEYSGERVKAGICRHCTKPLRLNRSQPEHDGGVVFVQPCACKCGANVVNINRFTSIFEGDHAKVFYDSLKLQKQRNWTTTGLDRGSRSYFIERYGEQEGNQRFDAKNKKTNTLSLAYFESTGLSKTEAKKAQRERQGTKSLEKYFLREGDDGIIKWIENNASWRTKLCSHSPRGNELEPSLIRVAEQKSQYWWLVTVLTDLSKRLCGITALADEHIDHIFSRTAGFHIGISPKIICAAPNLRRTKSTVNLAKKDLCGISRYNLEEQYRIFIQGERGELYNNISEALLRSVSYQWAGW